MDSLSNLAAAGSVADVTGFIGNFLALLIVAGAILLFTLRQGRASFVSLVMSLYAALGLFSVFPYDDLLKGDSAMGSFVASALVFGGLAFASYLLLSRVTTTGTMAMHTLILAILSVLTAGFVLAVGYHLLGLSAAVPLTPSLAAILGPDRYFFWWCVAPLAGMFLAAR